ncbi:U3 small nucleolar RNA-associated protein 13 [Angomonas deanei]|uniref:WD domain, G-beta repeat/Utp13 specific WD40 associated domain containing protein, putative n=1 Tax=Angomonas deanei TaxID=59799 RepID=A0A7G2CBG5_9TRYP|nr:U3 small nucleolar RNA-associated protein 13 [Angomonas deanei]CAD2217170.1 WD domain, G-beta repeat/Utp13 specific WD40 associated domain containing protein, putative [Angomonas deanei]|eukprot:EPY39124.1 U3 small nucleolar RNA-associated protein 13 [Angomonas deanei]
MPLRYATRKKKAKPEEKKKKSNKRSKPDPEEEPPAEKDETSVPNGSYVAVGTRQLQVYLLKIEVDQKKAADVVSDDEADREEENEKETTEENDRPEEVVYSLKPVLNWTAAQHAVSTVYFSPSGLYLVAGSTDGSVKVWNAFHHHLTHNLYNTFTAVIQTVYMDNTESYLVVGSMEGHVAVFDFVNKNLIATCRSHVQAVEAVVMNDARTHFFSIGRDRRLSILAFSHKDKTLQEARAVVVKEYVSAATFEDPQTLHLGSLDGIVATYGVSETETVQLRYRLAKPPASDATDNDEEFLVRSIAVRNKPKGIRHKVDDFLVDDNKAPNTLFVAYSGYNIGIVTPKSDAKAVYTTVSTLVGYLDQVLDAEVFPAESPYEYAIVTNSKDVRLYNTSGGCLSSQALQGHEDIVLTCAVSPDGQYIATGGKDKSVRIWSCATWECIGIGAKGHSGDVTAVHFNAKQTDTYFLLFSVGIDENLRLWDAGEVANMNSANAEIEHRAGVNVAHSGPIFALAVAPNDQYVATGGKDKSVNLWNVTGKKLFREASLKGHRRGISSLSFSSADRVLASASNDGSIRLWSLVSLSCVKTLQEDRIPVLQLCFFNQGTQVVTGNAEGVLRVWAVATSECVWSGELHDEKVWSLRVMETEEKTVFLSGSADGVLIATEDYTQEEVTRIREERSDMILKEQQLANAIRKKEFSRAFMLALQLNHPRHLRQVIAQWSAKGTVECEKALKEEILVSLTPDQLTRLLQFTREWISNSRHSGIASLVVYCFLGTFHYSEISKLPYARDLVAPLLAYTQKHSQRQHSTLDMTYYLDYLTHTIAPEALTTSSPLLTVNEKRPREE